jgi:hypothetical protein
MQHSLLLVREDLSAPFTARELFLPRVTTIGPAGSEIELDRGPTAFSSADTRVSGEKPTHAELFLWRHQVARMGHPLVK